MGKDSRKLKLKCNKFPSKRVRENIPRTKQSKITSFLNTAADSEYTVELGERDANSLSETTLPFFQINNQKRIMSTEQTSRTVSGLKSFCVIGCEPSTNGYNSRSK